MNSKPTAICINGRFLSHQVTGVQRYGRELLKHFDEICASAPKNLPDVEVLVPRNLKQIPTYKNLQVRSIGLLSGHAWEQIELPFYCRGRILFTPTATAPLIHNKNVLTMHDAAVFSAPEAYSRLYRTWYRVSGKVLGRTAKHVFTVSEFSKRELQSWISIPGDKVTVTHLGSEHIHYEPADASILGKHGLKPHQFVLAVGSENPNKNLHRLLRAAETLGRPDVPLVITGGHNSRVFGNQVTLPNWVKHLGYVSDRELRALYENAACFAFPSLYEGFGLPPLEAIASGCPIIVSKRASLPEVFNGLALFVDPENVGDIAQKMRVALNGSTPDREYLISGASNFSWKKCAEITWEVLQSCANQNVSG